MAEGVLIIGSSPAALQAARDLADSGIQVTLVEESAFLRAESQIGEPCYTRDSDLLEILKHPRMQTWTNTQVNQLQAGEDRGWDVTLVQRPRYVDLERCTACGECLEVCPVNLPGTDRKAIQLGGQPECAVITKQGISPCSAACPAGVHVQGYVALTAAGRFQEAYQLIHQSLPFPSVCGRVCNHSCEESCTRAEYDQPVNIMALKRFVSDREYGEQDREQIRTAIRNGRQARSWREEKIAVIGAGPAGLTAARDLARAGYRVTVFDANPQAGGMMRFGIPPHRLDYDQLDWEIEQILLEGVDLQLNSQVQDLPGLLEQGYAALLLATGANQAVKIGIENADHPDNWLSLDFLKKVCLGEMIDLTGRRVIVLGGGDVAFDAARSAIRLGGPEVRILCRGLRASISEIKAAENEGIEIIRDRVFKRIILDKKKIAGVECLKAEVGEVINGKRQFSELPGTEHIVPGDLVIWAVGQRPDYSYLESNDQVNYSNQGIQTDRGLMTNLEGVFTAGDAHRGATTFVVDAVGEGHQAAREIIAYLAGNPSDQIPAQRSQSILNPSEIEARLAERREAASPRIDIPCIQIEERINNFLEVERALTERQALRESGRCLACGPCSECLACLEVCEPGAIFHDQETRNSHQNFNWVIHSGSIKDYPPAPEIISLTGEEPLVGSAAAFKILRDHAFERTSLHPHPGPEIREEGGTGLFLCQCGGKISGSVDTAGLKEEAVDWPDVSLAVEVPFACTADGSKFIQRQAEENGLERMVLAACSCCELDQVCYSCTYQRVRCKQNLGVFSDLERSANPIFVNIREHCARVHPHSKVKATDAARILIRAALTGFPTFREGHPDVLQDSFQVLVVGESSSAQICLAALEKLGMTGNVVRSLSGRILRRGGQYCTPINGKEVRGDGLVLAPASQAELDYIAGKVVLANDHPLIFSRKGIRELSDLGIFISSAKLEPEISGEGAAAQLAAWVGRLSGKRHPSARVDVHRCRSCGTCLEVCGVGIPNLVCDEGGDHAWINPLLCLNCGVCAANCPSGAIIPGTHSDQELERMLVEVLP